MTKNLIPVLLPAEKNYCICDRELLTIKLALEEWRHWLEGNEQQFLVYTDHKNLKYLKSAKRFNPHQACWALFFDRSNFSLFFHTGTKNGRADALSKMFDSSEDAEPPEFIPSPTAWLGVSLLDLEQEITTYLENQPGLSSCP